MNIYTVSKKTILKNEKYNSWVVAAESSEQASAILNYPEVDLDINLIGESYNDDSYILLGGSIGN